jgi:hypothetical protein
MNNVTIRKEVRLNADILYLLQEIADKKKWSLKQTMEEILIERAIKERNRKNKD